MSRMEPPDNGSGDWLDDNRDRLLEEYIEEQKDNGDFIFDLAEYLATVPHKQFSSIEEACAYFIMTVQRGELFTEWAWARWEEEGQRQPEREDIDHDR